MKKRKNEGNVSRSMVSSTLLYVLVSIFQQSCNPSTYGQLKTGHPVRSAIHKQLNGRLVLQWVTTWESLLLYVLFLHKDLSLHVSYRVCSFGRAIVLRYNDHRSEAVRYKNSMYL
jgi:hypothetical protein